MPAGTDTSGRPSQLLYDSVVRTCGHLSTMRGALKGIVGHTIAEICAARIAATSPATTVARERANDCPAGSCVMGWWKSASHSPYVSGSTS